MTPETAILPGLDLTQVTGLALQFLFAMLRIGAFVVSAPLFAARFVPLTVRIVIAVALTVPVMALAPLPPPEQVASLSAVPMVLTEIAIGLAAGLTLSILFGAAMMAGDWIAATAGLSFAAQMDPSTGGQSPVIAQLMYLTLIALFLAEDGHLVALRIVLESYALVPPGAAVDPAAMITAGLAAGAQMFAFAARLMLPVVSVLLLVNVVIGVITRSAPQMNLFSFGFPLTLSVAVALLHLTAPAQGAALAGILQPALDLLTQMMVELGDG